jgi:hypothetical protein
MPFFYVFLVLSGLAIESQVRSDLSAVKIEDWSQGLHVAVYLTGYGVDCLAAGHPYIGEEELMPSFPSFSVWI